MKEYSTAGGEALPDLDEFAYPAEATALTAASNSGDAFTRMAPCLLVPSLSNRKNFNAEDLKTLAETVKAWGVRHPLIVRPLPGARLHDTRLETPKGQPLPTHEIVCGERRWLAAGLAGVATVPVIVRHLTDAQALEEQVTENVQREAYTALEEGEAFQRLMTQNGLTADQVAEKVGKSRRHIFNRTKLLDLRSETREALLKGEIDPTRALLLARIPDHEQQIKALADVVKKDWEGEFNMSLRRAEQYLQQEFMLKLDGARFDIQDITLVPEAGSCGNCAKRTGHNPDLWADVKGADLCTDAPCFHRKKDAHDILVLQQATANGQEVINGREAKILMPSHYGPIEGYLRLDSTSDSPTAEPLRKLLENQLSKEAIKPTLIENPHKKGEMLAVLPTTRVAELLKAEGEDKAAEKLNRQMVQQEEADGEAEKKKLKDAYEIGWRNALLKRTWVAVQATPQASDTGNISEAVLRRVCAHYASQANAERAKHLCSLLDLGKVAPVEALSDYIKTCEEPDKLLLLLVMQKDVAYTPWMPSEYGMNATLLQVASEFGVDVTEVQADLKKEIKAKVSTKAVQPADPSLPVLRHKEGTGENKKTGATFRAPAAPAKQNISASEATSGIAAAMQQMGSGQSDAAGVCPQDEHAAPTEAPQAVATALAVAADGATPDDGALKLGAHVQVRGAQVLRPLMGRFAGKTGKIIGDDGTDWIVKLDGLKGRNGGDRTFTPSEIGRVQRVLAPQITRIDPVQGTLPVGVISIGSRVKVLGNVNSRLSKWIGKTGTVQAKTGPESWDVTFTGRGGGLAGFHVSELEWVA
ncbi:MAG: ParB/RepB/Spo0J family partition protein [Xanthomonadaceae bacterium]|nr:ParB/RepB/Spo0J family partition protein [Xanthomonadaceae bacterium]MBH2008105.1 ParB/RepB/Spo0J family partition protein [Xanthomonadaceae bacterium]